MQAAALILGNEADKPANSRAEVAVPVGKNTRPLGLAQAHPRCVGEPEGERFKQRNTVIVCSTIVADGKAGR